MAAFLRELLKALGLIVSSVLHDVADLTRKVALIRERKEGEGDIALYVRGLKRLALVVCVFPLLILLIGVVGNYPTIVSIAGLLWALATIVLFLIGAPVGLLLTLVFNINENSAKRYVRLVLSALLVELSLTFFLSIVPVHNNLPMLPVALIALSIIAINAFRGEQTKFTWNTIGALAYGFLMLFTLSCFFPNLFAKLRGGRETIDQSLTEEVSALPETISDTFKRLEYGFNPVTHRTKTDEGKRVENLDRLIMGVGQYSPEPEGGETFVVNRGDTVKTAYFRRGQIRDIWSNKEFQALSTRRANNKRGWEIDEVSNIGPGTVRWQFFDVPGNEGRLIVVGLRDNTVIKFF